MRRKPKYTTCTRCGCPVDPKFLWTHDEYHNLIFALAAAGSQNGSHSTSMALHYYTEAMDYDRN